jgi:hypothetical protein
MDIPEAFTFVPNDREWISKMAIGSLFALLIPLAGLGLIPLAGWSIEIARRIIHNEQEILPGWGDLGKYIVDGLKGIFIGLIWNLPLIICSAILVVLGGAVDSGENLFTFLVSTIATLYNLVVGILLLGAFGILAETSSFGAALNPIKAGQVIFSNLGDWIIAFVIGAIASSVFTTIGTLLCIIGVFPAITYTFANIGHLYGQAYRRGSFRAT